MDKITINKSSDILKFSFTELKKTKLSKFEGKFFNDLFEQAMKCEKEEKEQIIVKDVEFELVYHVDFGQRIGICGEAYELGQWDIKKRSVFNFILV